MQLRVVPSPTSLVTLDRYARGKFPVFDELREKALDKPALRALANFFDQVAEIVVLENRAQKAVTALCSRWTLVEVDGTSRTHQSRSDSYLLHPLRPVLEADGRILLSPSNTLTESLVRHVLAGGGFLGAGNRPHAGRDVIEVWFQLNFIAFEDGEVSGSDPDRYALELQLRNQAASFVAHHIRTAIAQGHSPEPVLQALESLPQLDGERYPRLIAQEAQNYLRYSSMQATSFDPKESALRHLENRPALPKFYRSKESD